MLSHKPIKPTTGICTLLRLFCLLLCFQNVPTAGAATLQGFVVLSGVNDSAGFSGATVYLIRKAYDPMIMDTTLTLVDSFLANEPLYTTWPGSNGWGLVYRFSKNYTTIPSGTLLLKAALLPSDTNFQYFLPTYYDSSLQWNAAGVLNSNSFNGGYEHIILKSGFNSGGPGFIGGSVVLGADKSTGVGDPLAQRILILTNAVTGKALGFTYSDVSGHFQFSNLPYGTYQLFGDVWGKDNPALTITINNASATVSNVVFEENSHDFTGKIGGLGLGAVPPMLNDIRAYPNPAGDYLAVDGLTHIRGNKTVSLTAMNGTVVYSGVIPDGAAARIPVASLAPGNYLLRVQTDNRQVQMMVTK